MSFSNNFISNVETIFSFFSSKVIKKSLEDYCYLNTALSEENFLNDDGSLSTVFKIYGSKEVIGDDQIDLIKTGLSDALQSSFNNEGHKLQFVFIRDDDRTEEMLDYIVTPYKKASIALGFDFDDIYDGKKEKLKTLCSYESAYLVATTDKKVSPESVDLEEENIKEKTKNINYAIKGQNIYNNYTSVENNHIAFVEKIKDAFFSNSINIETLNVKEATKDIKQSINSKLVSPDWEPILPNDKIPIRKETDLSLNEKDISSFMWPKLSSQIFPSDAVKIEDDIIKFGDRYVTPLTFTIPPQKILDFNKLIKSIDKTIPWQISMTLRSVRKSKLNLKSLATNLTAWTNSDNRLIKEGLDEIKEKIDKKDPVVELSIDAITWSDDIKELKKRKAIIQKFLQSWGNATVDSAKGDLYEAILSTIPAITPTPYGNVAYAPLDEVIELLPIIRPSHVWESGSVLFRTDTSKIFPYQPGSSKQNAWNYLYFATPGSGKSVLLNSINLANLNTLGVNNLPLMGIIDIGVSSKYFIEMVRDTLQENQRHLVITEKLKNTKDYAINILDTQLGSRSPLVDDLFFLANTLTLAVTPPGKEQYPSTEDLIRQILVSAYDYYSDKNEPKLYKEKIDKDVDEAILKHGIEIIDEDTTWWNIVDDLFKKRDYLSASKAQKYAVPIISDLVSIAQTNVNIKNTYSKVIIETGETLIEYFQRSIGELLNNYPMLSIPTKFDLSQARVISLDLQSVAPEGEGSAKKQTSLMYMIARYIMTRNFFIDEEILKKVPEFYYSFYKEKIEILRETPKILSYDEFHRTSGVKNVRLQVLRDMREGRKWRMQVNLVSQLLKDFDDELISMSDGSFILSGGEDVDEITERFKLNKTMKKILRFQINGPTSKGAPFLFKFKTKTGSYCQFLYSTLSPIEMWSFNTTAEDCVIREKLAKIVGQKEARKMLAKLIPSGSAKNIIEKEVLKTNDPSINPIDNIVKKILDKFNIIN